MPTTAPAIVICVRDPDWENAFTIIGNAKVYDIDLGRSDLSDRDERAEWLESHEHEITELHRLGFPEAAAHYQEIIDEIMETFT